MSDVSTQVLRPYQQAMIDAVVCGEATALPVGVGEGEFIQAPPASFRLLCQTPNREPEVLDPETSEAEAARVLASLGEAMREAGFRVETDVMEVRAINPVTMALECRYWTQARVDVYV